MKEKITIAELVKQLFITNWSVSINHSKYFEQCLPKSCSYPYKDNTNVLYAFTKLLSVYGGLSIALRFIVPLIIKKIMRRRQRQHTIEQSEGI